MNGNPHQPQIDPVERQIAEVWPTAEWFVHRVLVAVSGGPDSVALLVALSQIASRADQLGAIEVVHVNHGWRGVESDQDAQFVYRLAQQIGVRCHAITEPSTPNRRSEAAARRFRYENFRQTAEEIGARYVATAHTAEDQVETILHRIIRGTGLQGLAGIPGSRPLSRAVSVIRPMLRLTKSELLGYLERRNQAYCVDSTNRQTTYTRNRIRLELLPELRELNPQIDEAILQLGNLADDAQQVIRQHVCQELEQCLTESRDNTVLLDRIRLASQPSAVRREIFLRIWSDQNWPRQAMTYAHWHRLSDAVEPANRDETSFDLPGPVHVTLTREAISLCR